MCEEATSSGTIVLEAIVLQLRRAILPQVADSFLTGPLNNTSFIVQDTTRMAYFLPYDHPSQDWKQSLANLALRMKCI